MNRLAVDLLIAVADNDQAECLARRNKEPYPSDRNSLLRFYHCYKRDADSACSGAPVKKTFLNNSIIRREKK